MRATSCQEQPIAPEEERSLRLAGMLDAFVPLDVSVFFFKSNLLFTLGFWKKRAHWAPSVVNVSVNWVESTTLNGLFSGWHVGKVQVVGIEQKLKQNLLTLISFNKFWRHAKYCPTYITWHGLLGAWFQKRWTERLGYLQSPENRGSKLRSEQQVSKQILVWQTTKFRHYVVFWSVFFSTNWGNDLLWPAFCSKRVAKKQPTSSVSDVSMWMWFTNSYLTGNSSIKNLNSVSK